MKKKFLALFIILFVGILAAVFFLRANKSKTAGDLNLGKAANSGANNISDKIDNIVVEQQADATTSEKVNNIPDKTLLNVLFLSQAPFGVWDPLHEDACEEASLIIVKFFKDGVKLVSREKAEEEIQGITTYENKNDYGISITLEELNKIAKDYYNLNTGRVEKNITADDIKKELVAGRPVIVGAAGKILPNPNFRNGGPNYHMLVVKGYDSNGFITNDPGTRKGEGFRYTYQALFNAIHDWEPDNIMNGAKNYLVFD